MCLFSFFFFFNDTATTEIYTLSLHDALPICIVDVFQPEVLPVSEKAEKLPCVLPARNYEDIRDPCVDQGQQRVENHRSEEHTSELQSLAYLVCRLLLEKKKEQPVHVSRTQHH